MTEYSDAALAEIQQRTRVGNEGIAQVMGAGRPLQTAAALLAEIEGLVSEIKSGRQQLTKERTQSASLQHQLFEAKKGTDGVQKAYEDRGGKLEELEASLEECRSERATTRQLVLDLQLLMKNSGAPPDLIRKCGEIIGIT